MRPSYVPIKPKERLYQEIVEQIQGQIVSGALKSGDQIPAERELADQFGVSRTAVREAIKSLTEKGLIEVFVGRGTFVTELSPERVVASLELLLKRDRHSRNSLYDAREILEVPIARLAARHRTPEQLDRLRALVRRMEAHVSSHELITIDDEFHLELARATANQVLAVLSQTITSLLRRDRMELTSLPDEMPAAVASHRKIVRALEARDPEAAALAMAETLAHVPRLRAMRDRLARGRDHETTGVAAD